MRSKRILSLVLALVMVLGTFGTVFAEPTDNTRVDWLIEEGLVLGYGDGTYGLDKAITRAEVATMVVRALGLEEEAGKMKNIPSVFADMRGTNVAWANGYVNVAVGKGIINGYEDGTFKPSQDITYAEVAAILVRALDGMTPAEIAAATGRDWATTYLVKAAELGVLDDVVILDYNAKAQRETIFEMVYNTINKGFGRFTIVKAIVLENNRVERLAKDEIVVEVIREVQRANQLDATIYARGDQEKLVIEAKVGDVEDLLGKVADFTLDKDGKVVKVTPDETYKIEVVQADATRNKFGKYTVEIGERYKGSDERIYRTYLNNKAYAYEDFYRLDKDDEFAVDYARVTVKNGKVLFIDGFNFDDVMPVKELKDVRTKATIVAYDDVREGNTIELTVSDKQVILVKNNKLSKGTLEDVKIDNVIHSFKDGSATEYLVLQDLAIEGKLDRITETRTVTSVVVDGKAYDVPTVSPKKAVYEFKSNDKFYTLDADTAFRELDTFRGEEVRVLLGLDGKLQYIGSPVEFGDFVGIATKIVGREMRVLNPENKLNDYTANLDTLVNALGAGSTGHQNLNLIPRNSLVYVNASDNDLVEVIELMKPVEVNSLNKRNIELDHNRDENFRITDETTIYVINSNGVAEVRTIADVVKAFEAYEKAVADGKTPVPVKASLIDEKEYDRISIRGDKYARPENAFAIAFYDLDITPKLEDAVYGKLIRYFDRTQGRSEILVELTNGEQKRFTVGEEYKGTNFFEEGLYYEIQESKDTEGLAVYVNKVVFKHGTISRIEGNAYTIIGETGLVYEVRNTEFFGRKPKTGDKISYVLTPLYNDLKLVVNPSVEDVAGPMGLVTYMNSTGTRLQLDNAGEIYVLDANTRLINLAGNLEAVGNTDIRGALTLFADYVKLPVEVNRDGVVVKLVRTVPPTPGVNKTALRATIATAETKVEADYTAASWAPFAADLVIAKAVAADANATQIQVDTAKTSLESKMNALVGIQTGAATLIDNLPATVTLVNESQVVAARAAYDLLSPAQQNALGAARLAKLLTAEQQIADLKQADIDAVADAKAELEAAGFTFVFGPNPNAIDNDEPSILKVADHVDGAEYTFALPSGQDSRVEISPNGDNVNITRTLVGFNFVLDVLITKGDATDVVRFFVEVLPKSVSPHVTYMVQ